MTAETAVALPALLLVVGALLVVTRALGLQLAAQDAAQVGARSAARGDPDATVLRLAGSVAPGGARVTIVRSAGLVRVRVEGTLSSGSGALARLLPPLTVAATGVALDEAAESSAPSGAGAP